MIDSESVNKLSQKVSALEIKCSLSNQTAQRYQSAFENSREALLLFSRRKKFLNVSKRLVQLSQYSKQELLSMTLDILFPDLLSHLHIPTVEQENQTFLPCVFETLLLTQRKNRVPVKISVCLLPFQPNADLVFQGTIHDITLGKKNQDEFQRAEKLKSIGDLAGGIAHNFNNIMTGLYGNIALARLELSTETKAFSYLKKAENSMEEAIKLTKRLLTFAKGGDPIIEDTDIAALVLDTIAFNLSGSNIRPRVISSQNLWPIHGDRGQLEQVISNIVINSRQAMPKGGVFTIHMENSSLLKDNLLTISKGPYVKITLSDEGAGIHHKNVDRIFDPYFTTQKNGGGMGLAICYSIIKKHNGHIYVSSQRGTGTSITLYLPAISPLSQKETTMESDLSDPNSDAPAKILVMDDEEPIRTITKKMLETFGYSVTLTENGEEAIEVYSKAFEEKPSFDLVIMDLTIPGGMGGKDASKKILGIDPGARIVISSGYSNDPIMSNHQDYGLKGIIPKPYRIAEFKKTVDQLLSDI